MDYSPALEIPPAMVVVPIVVWCVIIACVAALIVGGIYLFRLIVKALKVYIKAKEVREEKAASMKTLGEVLKKHRTDSRMTQEFVAEYLGISRQAVSKWESGASDPSTSNLIALAKLFGTTPEELLKEVER